MKKFLFCMFLCVICVMENAVSRELSSDYGTKIFYSYFDFHDINNYWNILANSYNYVVISKTKNVEGFSENPMFGGIMDLEEKFETLDVQFGGIEIISYFTNDKIKAVSEQALRNIDRANSFIFKLQEQYKQATAYWITTLYPFY